MPLPPANATCQMTCRIGDTTARWLDVWSSRSARRSHGCGRGRRTKAESVVIDPKLLRTQPQGVARNLARRGYVVDVAALQALSEHSKPLSVEGERLRE